MDFSQLQFKQFKATLIVALLLFAFIFIYLSYSSFSYQKEYITRKIDVLQGFAERSMTRLQTNPSLYKGDDATILGDDRMQFVSSYQQLSTHLNNVPKEQHIQTGKVNLYINQFGGLWSVSEVILIYRIHHQGEDYFAYFHNNTRFNDLELQTFLTDKMQPAIITASALIIALFIFQLFQISRVSSMVFELANWADTVSAGKPIAPPKMKSGGINYLAKTINKSLDTFSHILEKEHAFARFSSHELRTQVAVLSANMELLELIMNDLKPQERRVLNRMLSAIEDMKYQTEALLWLSKETEKDLVTEMCSIKKIVAKSVEENQLYLNHEQVKVVIVGDDLSFMSHPTLLQIACNNLIRNAFQNTEQGQVTVEINERSFTITNQNEPPLKGQQTQTGFGIGLIIVERILDKLQFTYHVDGLDSGRSVQITLPE